MLSPPPDFSLRSISSTSFSCCLYSMSHHPAGSPDYGMLPNVVPSHHQGQGDAEHPRFPPFPHRWYATPPHPPRWRSWHPAGGCARLVLTGRPGRLIKLSHLLPSSPHLSLGRGGGKSVNFLDHTSQNSAGK